MTMRSLFLFLMVIAVTAANAAPRTFVASTGSDAHPCTAAAPCRGFAKALTVTDVDGEIIVLDSAGYGPVSINQSVSIIAPRGVYAGISVSGANHGVSVNSGKVVLRGLSINGVDPASLSGIRVMQATEVHIDRCDVSNMGQQGIAIAPAAGATTVHVSDSIVRSNALDGISMSGSATALYVRDTSVVDNGGNGIVVRIATATLDRVRSERNGGVGVYAYPVSGEAKVLARDTVAARNSLEGFLVRADAGMQARLALDRSASNFNGAKGVFALTDSTGVATLTVMESVANENVSDGIVAQGGGAKAAVTASSVTRNTGFGLAGTSGGTLESAGNNLVRENVGGATSGAVVNVGTI